MTTERENSTPRLLYMTARDKTEAFQIGEALVNEKLVACVNIFSGMESIYHWEGKLCKENEVVVIAKTTSDLVQAVVDRVIKLHSYAVPCVVAIPILEGNPGFLNWVENETKKAPK